MKTFGASADRLLHAPAELRGMKLRYALLAVLLRAERPLGIGELIDSLEAAGLRIVAPHPNKAVSDALRCEARKPRVLAVRRGTFVALRLPDSTRRRILTWYRIATDAARGGGA